MGKLKVISYFNNEVAKGYLLKALNYMIQHDEIERDKAQEVIDSFNFEMDLMTEQQAEEYYRNNFLVHR